MKRSSNKNREYLSLCGVLAIIILVNLPSKWGNDMPTFWFLFAIMIMLFLGIIFYGIKLYSKK